MDIRVCSGTINKKQVHKRAAAVNYENKPPINCMRRTKEAKRPSRRFSAESLEQ